MFFVTQTPKDVPGDVLGQLGNRVQHALRAFTPEDAKALKATVSTFPALELYDLEELLPALGIGEAAVTILSESGVPTPVVHTRMVAPRSRMAPADDVAALAAASPLREYATRVERESAHELLAARMERAREPAPAEPAPAGPRRWSTCPLRGAVARRRRSPRAAARPSATSSPRARARCCSARCRCGVFGMLRKRL